MRLDRNQRQSREEERVLGRNVVHPERDVQPREGYREGSYRRRGRQITWRAGGLSIGGGYKRGGGGGGNMFNRGGTQTDPRRDPNVINVDCHKLHSAISPSVL